MSEKIKIAERDLSVKPSGETTSSDIVFIPGFVHSGTFTNSAGATITVTTNEPILCTTVKQFTDVFGATVPSNTTGSGTTAVTTYDKSYIMAKELLNMGLPVLYAATSTSFSGAAPTLSDALLNKLKDRGECDVKYITYGGYAAVSTSTTIYSQLANAAYTRGDAVALVDLDSTVTPANVSATATIVGTATQNNHLAIFYPWGTYNLPTYKDAQDKMIDVSMPASFGYLECLAKSIKTAPNWLAMAGVNRGIVPNLKKLDPASSVTNKVAEDLQPKSSTVSNGKISVNCITEIKPYGLTVWGNRTARPVKAAGLEQSHFLNVRNMVSDVKKVLYSTAKACMFEQNTDTLWLQFKNGVTPLLNQLKLGNALYDYKIIKSNVNNDGNPLGRGEMAAVVRIYPINTVEYFELAVEIADQDVTVS